MMPQWAGSVCNMSLWREAQSRWLEASGMSLRRCVTRADVVTPMYTRCRYMWNTHTHTHTHEFTHSLNHADAWDTRGGEGCNGDTLEGGGKVDEVVQEDSAIPTLLQRKCCALHDRKRSNEL